MRRKKINIPFEFTMEYPKTAKFIKKNDTVNRRCNKCGRVVLKETFVPNYPFQCVSCDENLYDIETHLGEPHTDVELAQLCEDTLILELDC